MSEHAEGNNLHHEPASVTNVFRQIEDQLTADARSTYDAEAGVREIIARIAELSFAELSAQRQLAQLEMES